MTTSTESTGRHHAATFADALQVSDADLTAWLDEHAGDGAESRHAA